MTTKQDRRAEFLRGYLELVERTGFYVDEDGYHNLSIYPLDFPVRQSEMKRIRTELEFLAEYPK